LGAGGQLVLLLALLQRKEGSEAQHLRQLLRKSPSLEAGLMVVADTWQEGLQLVEGKVSLLLSIRNPCGEHP
jgi:hypothetical protein